MHQRNVQVTFTNTVCDIKIRQEHKVVDFEIRIARDEDNSTENQLSWETITHDHNQFAISDFIRSYK